MTVIFADVVGSTALGERVDAETLRWAMQRWFDRMRRAVERHGGTIEDYRGDGVMAVFGIPVAHEDDALRAARAALDMRAAGQELARRAGRRLRVRIGLNTGEAATGSSATSARSPPATPSTSPRGWSRPRARGDPARRRHLPAGRARGRGRGASGR